MLHVSGDHFAGNLPCWFVWRVFPGWAFAIGAIFGIEVAARLGLRDGPCEVAAITGVLEAALGVRWVVDIGLGASPQFQASLFARNLVFATAGVPIQRRVEISKDVAVEGAFLERVRLGFFRRDG